MSSAAPSAGAPPRTVPGGLELAAIAAMTPDRVIGRAGGLPWHHPADLRFFKHVTSGHAVLMGRRTFESIGRPLPGRLNLVWTRSAALPGAAGHPDVRSLADPASELPPLLHGRTPPLFVIGGARVYRALLPFCETVYLTVIDEPHAGDTWLPEFEHDFLPPETLDRQGPCHFMRYQRKSAPAPLADLAADRRPA